jgi:hypothetical protein
LLEKTKKNHRQNLRSTASSLNLLQCRYGTKYNQNFFFIFWSLHSQRQIRAKGRASVEYKQMKRKLDWISCFPGRNSFSHSLTKMSECEPLGTEAQSTFLYVCMNGWASMAKEQKWIKKNLILLIGERSQLWDSFGMRNWIENEWKVSHHLHHHNVSHRVEAQVWFEGRKNFEQSKKIEYD